MPRFVIHWHAYFPTGLFYLLPGPCLPCSKFDVSGYQFIPTWNKEKCTVRDKQHHTIIILVLKSCSCSQAKRQHLGQCPGWSWAGDPPILGADMIFGLPWFSFWLNQVTSDPRPTWISGRTRTTWAKAPITLMLQLYVNFFCNLNSESCRAKCAHLTREHFASSTDHNQCASSAGY